MASRELEYGNFQYDLAFKLRAMRDLMECTREEASKKFGISPTQVSNYENSRENPSLLYVYKIAKATGVTLYDLVELDKKEFVKKLYFN